MKVEDMPVYQRCKTCIKFPGHFDKKWERCVMRSEWETPDFENLGTEPEKCLSYEGKSGEKGE
jgi:hypothetical protein